MKIINNDSHMSDSQKLNDMETKRENTKTDLNALIKMKKQEDAKQYRGKLHWEGDLAKMRKDR